MDYDKWLPMGRTLLDKHGLHDWKFNVDHLGLINPIFLHCHLGQCKHDEKEIVVDMRAGHRFRQVVLHQIVHALQGKPDPPGHHDDEWIGMAERIGCSKSQVSDYCRVQLSDELIRFVQKLAPKHKTRKRTRPRNGLESSSGKSGYVQ